MKRGLVAFLAVLTLGVGAGTAAAASQVIVSPSNPQGWCWTLPCATTTTGGAVTFVSDPTAPGSPDRGALQLTTDATTAAKAQALHATNTPLRDITQLSYWTRQVGGPVYADPAYQLAMCLNGGTTSATCGFTTLVFEPYQNPELGAIVPGAWQYWQVDHGTFWSTRSVTCSNGAVIGGAGGVGGQFPLSFYKAACPEAFAFQFLVNLGSFNPGDTVETDLFNFNGTVYNFEPDKTKPGCADGQGVFQDRGNHGGDGPKTHECKNDRDKNDNNDDGQGSDSEE